MNPIFFKFLFNSLIIKTELENASHGGTMDILNVGIIKRTGFPLPPLQLQENFASIVEEVENLKEKQKQSKEEINQMFDSLMKQAFNGELVK
jgi:type I restriction enzyme S subunit